MFGFAILILLLILAIIFFFTYPIVKRKILPDKFNIFCERKIKKIAKKNNFLSIDKFNYQNYDQNSFDFNHILFGNKFVYLLKDCCYVGDIEGNHSNKSWIYKKYREKNNQYIDNLLLDSDENIRDFAGIFNINPNILVCIYIVPDECNLFLEGIGKDNAFIIHHSTLKKLIAKFESKNVKSLDPENVRQNYEFIKGKNE